MSGLVEHIHTPVAIVGAGACGLTAALALHRLGIECVVLERDAVPAGNCHPLGQRSKCHLI